MRTMLSVGTMVGRRARIPYLALLTGFLLALAPVPGEPRANAQELPATFPLTQVADSGVSGTGAVAAVGEGSSLVALAVVGLEPGASYRSTLQAGTCDEPSASFTELLLLQADDAGTAVAIGPVRFRGVEGIAPSVFTDGNHIIVLRREGDAVACGTIPARPSTSIDLQRFVDMATSAGCTDLRNQLFVIDGEMVLWIARGSCADASYRTQLFGSTPSDTRCSLSDSIAGPLRQCSDDTVRPLFDTITANDQALDLGLGAEHQVMLAWSASSSRD